MAAFLFFRFSYPEGGGIASLPGWGGEWKGAFCDGFVSFCGLLEGGCLFMVPAHEN